MADVNLTHTGAQLDDAISKVLADYADVSGVTAVETDVATGKIFVDASGVEKVGTSNGTGTNTSDATGTAADLLSPETMYGATGKVTGTMPDKSGTTQDATAAIDGSYISYPIPANGFYNALSKLRESFAHMASLIGLTAAKIVSGNTILGVPGSAVVGAFSGTPTAGDTPVLISPGGYAVKQNEGYVALKDSNDNTRALAVTIVKTGTYRFKSYYYTGGDAYLKLYKNGVEVAGSLQTLYQEAATYSYDLACTAGDVIALWGQSYGTGKMYAESLTACVNWANGISS